MAARPSAFSLFCFLATQAIIMQSTIFQPLSDEELERIPTPQRPLHSIPELSLSPKINAHVPDDEECERLWDKYKMFDNIRAHCLLVAEVATELATKAAMSGLPVSVPEVRAAGLLHDIAKTYCVCHGGGHADLGASWVVQETHNHRIAQGVFHHVWWPWELPLENAQRLCALPFFILYADKRARHDEFVSLEDRYVDLYERYGNSDVRKKSIYMAYLQGKSIENGLSRCLGMDLSSWHPAARTARKEEN